MSVDIDFVKVGKRIRDVRKAQKITQEKLAQECGCVSNHLSAVETGACRPSLELIAKIATVLDSSIDYFLMDTPCANPKYIINSRIAPKLEACTARDLQYIEQMIDTLLVYRDGICAGE